MNSEFELEHEEFCKKVWKPWLEAGGWTVIDLTQPQSPLYQIPKGISEEEKIKLKAYLKSLCFPHDLDITRGDITWMADYKFHKNTKHGIWISKVDYDKYYSLKAPFILLIWCDDRKARYIHTISDNPSKYRIETLDTYEGYIQYYDITADCIEVKSPDIKLEVPQRFDEYITWLKKLSEYGLKGKEPPPKIIIKPEDIDNAMKELSHKGLTHIIMVRKYKRTFPKRSRGKPSKLDIGLAVKIRDLKQAGYSYRKIAKELNVSLGMVQRALKQLKLSSD